MATDGQLHNGLEARPLRRTELRIGIVAHETEDFRSAARVDTNPQSRSIIWTSRLTIHEVVGEFRPFLEGARMAELVTFPYPVGSGVNHREFGLNDTKRKLDEIESSPNPRLSFRLTVFTHETGYITLEEKCMGIPICDVSASGGGFKPDSVRELFDNSAAEPLLPHFDAIVADLPDPS